MEEIIFKLTKKIATLMLKRYKPGIIGIAGEVGKTSTKEAICAVLGGERRVRVSPRDAKGEEAIVLGILGDWPKGKPHSWLREIIIPSLIKLLWKQKKYPELLIIEYDVTRPGEMKCLLDIARPQVVVVTAMGETSVYAGFQQKKE